MKVSMITGCLLLTALAMVGPAHADDAEEATRYIQVSGTAVTKVVPDIIVWHLSVTDENTNLTEAKHSNDAKLKQLLKAADKLDVADADVQTGQLSFSRVYNRDSHGNPISFKHYRVSRQVSIRQRDLKKFDEFLEALVANVELEASYQFESSRMTDIRWETRLKALKLAKKKAADMAEALDAKIGKPLRIEEQSAADRWANPFYNGNANYISPAQNATPDSISGTLAPGTIDISITVNVRFAIE